MQNEVPANLIFIISYVYDDVPLNFTDQPIQHQWIYLPLGWIIWMEPDRPSHHAIWKPVRLHLGDPVHEVTVYISSHTEI